MKQNSLACMRECKNYKSRLASAFTAIFNTHKNSLIADIVNCWPLPSNQTNCQLPEYS